MPDRSPQAPLSTEGGDRCPVCDVHAEPRIDLGDYRLFRCHGCGSWSSDAQLRGASTSFVPDAYFENAELDRDKWEDLLCRLPEHGEKLHSLLDVGCGTGAFLDYASRRLPGAQLQGIELDEERAERARAANPRAQIHQGDAMEVSLRIGGPFDLITLWDVFEHVTAPTRLLKSLARSLAPGGCIYVQTIHETSLVPAAGRLCYGLSGGRLRYPARRTHEPHHLVFFTRQGLEHAAGDVTSRPRTGQAVVWEPPKWTTSQASGADQRTPELTAVVQEIVDRPGWSAGNALVFVISGSGTRTARSYDGTSDRAAILEVEYLSPTP